MGNVGSYLTIVNDTQDVCYVKIGPDEAATKIAATIVGLIPDIGCVASNYLQSLVSAVQGELAKHGYVTLQPGQSYKYGKMSLSLWQQGTCRRVRVNPSNSEQILVETLYMRPIFSGATDNSNIDHSITWWLNKWGVEKPAEILRRV